MPAMNRRQALALLAGSSNGMTESLLLAHGFPIKLMAELVSELGPTIDRPMATVRDAPVTTAEETTAWLGW
jgi:hypothetical protein